MKMRLLGAFLVFCFNQALVFAIEKFPGEIVSTDGKPVIWTANWTTDVRVEFFGATSLSLYLHCNLLCEVLDCKGNKAPKRKKVDFCLHNQCKTVSQDRPNNTIQLGKATGQVKFDLETGGTLEFKDVSQNTQLPLSAATCTDETESGISMTSNQLFILDFRKNFPKNIWKPSKTLEFNRNAPSTVDCLKKGLEIDTKINVANSSVFYPQPRVSVKFEWFVCSSGNAADCETTKTPLRNISAFDKWPVQVFANGQLYSPFVPDNVASKLQNKRLMCFLMKKPVAYYSSPVRMADLGKRINSPFLLRPDRGETSILYNSSEYSVTLPVLFETPVTGATNIIWKFIIGKKKTELKNEPENKKNKEFGVSVSVGGHSITFRGPFPEHIEKGEFECNVHTFDRRLIGVYEVKIKGSPRPTSAIPKMKYVMSGDNAEVNCVFENSKRITPSISVNGKELNLTSVESVKEDNAVVNAKLKKWAPPIRFSIHPARKPKLGDTIRYTLHNAIYSQDLDSTHVVTCIAANGPFKTRARVVIKTIPRPRLSPDFFKNCRVSCDMSVEVENYEEYKKKGIRVTYALLLGESFYPRGSPTYKRVKWEDVSPGGIHYGCVQLHVPNGDEIRPICKEMKKPGGGLSLIIIILCIVMSFIFVVAVVIIVWKRKEIAKKCASHREKPSRNEEEEALKGEGDESNSKKGVALQRRGDPSI